MGKAWAFNILFKTHPKRPTWFNIGAWGKHGLFPSIQQLLNNLNQETKLIQSQSMGWEHIGKTQALRKKKLNVRIEPSTYSHTKKKIIGAISQLLNITNSIFLCVLLDFR